MRVELVNFRGHDEIALGQSVNLVRPQSDFSLSPGQHNVGMMSLLFRNCPYSIYEIQGLLEVGESEIACEMVFLDHAPL